MPLTAKQNGGEESWWGWLWRKVQSFGGLNWVASIFVFAAIWFLAKGIQIWHLLGDEVQTIGDVGDFIGGTAGTLGSLAALLYLISSVRSQQKAIEVTRKAQQQEQFSEMFFNYLDFLRNIVHEMKYEFEDEIFEGHHVFRGYVHHIIKNLKAGKVEDVFVKKSGGYEISEDEGRVGDSGKKGAKAILHRFFDANGTVSFYFSNLYGLLSMVDQSLGAVIDEAEQEKYIQVIENQLTSYAKLMLAIYALCKYADNGVQEYIDEDFYETFEEHFDPFWEGKVSSFMLPPNVHIFKR